MTKLSSQGEFYACSFAVMADLQAHRAEVHALAHIFLDTACSTSVLVSIDAKTPTYAQQFPQDSQLTRIPLISL